MTMSIDYLATLLFQSIDKQDKDAFLGFLADDILFRFGNAEPVIGKSAVCDAVSGFFASVKGTHYELLRAWDKEGVLICHGSVTYTRHDLTTLTVPYANILILDNSLIKEYLIFVNISKLYA